MMGALLVKNKPNFALSLLPKDGRLAKFYTN